ncbi:MAG: SDR family oxidoreductase [Anaerolineaceae bacterium]|nr:SDR family oxidoreductase [Anaerolineaceae bacterium]
MTSNDMLNKLVMVTGATGGIGKETARALQQMGAHVVIVGRNPQKTADVVAEMKSQNPSGGEVDGLVADLSSLADIRRLAEEFKQKYDRLDVLVNNAGAYFNKREISVDGFEMTFALNHLGYFYLTNLLLDLIKSSAPARIVNVSSGAHAMGKINFDNLNAKGLFVGWTAYGTSKLMNILFTRELSRRLEGTRVTVNALHPGFVATNFGHNGNGIGKWLIQLTQRSALTPEQGAQTSIYLASSPEVSGVSGAYFSESKIVQPSKAAQDDDLALRLWEVSEQLIAEREKTFA